jgi:hypothetical protein
MTTSDSTHKNCERQLQKVLEDTTTKRGPRLHDSGLTGSLGRPPGPVWSPLSLCCLVLLSTIYSIDFKVILGQFIQQWLREVTRIDDVVVPWPLLHLGLYKDAPSPPGGHLSFRSRLNTRRIRARLSNIVD